MLAAGLTLRDGLVSLVAKPEPSTAEECLDASDSSSMREAVIDSWLCDTRYANIWAPDMEHVVLDDNRDLLEKHFDRIHHASVGDDASLSSEATSDPNLRGGQISRLFAHWPEYRGKPSAFLGSVRSAHNIVDDEVSSDWVFQLGTVRDEHVLVYLRVSGPPGWSPPHESECALAIAEGIPLARGYVPRANSAGTYDVIYSMSSLFMCLDEVDGEELRDSLTPELQDAFDEGASLDRW